MESRDDPKRMPIRSDAIGHRDDEALKLLLQHPIRGRLSGPLRLLLHP